MTQNTLVFDLRINLEGDEIADAVKESAKCLSGTGQAFRELVFEKMDQALTDKKINELGMAYMNTVCDEAVLTAIRSILMTDWGKQRLEVAVRQAVNARFDDVIDQALADYIQSAHFQASVINAVRAYTDTRDMEGRINRAVSKELDVRAGERLLNTVWEVVDAKSGPVITKIVDNKLPGWVARTVKEMLAGAKYAFLAKQKVPDETD